jgi:hypothetical protein
MLACAIASAAISAAGTFSRQPRPAGPATRVRPDDRSEQLKAPPAGG